MDQYNIELAKHIEHTALKPDVKREDIKKLCQEAIDYSFLGVCVPPYYVRFAKELVRVHPVKVITVAGFPLGYNTTTTKVEEAKKAIEDGADEIDMVINISAYKSGDIVHLREDIENMSTLCRLKNKVLKVIIEICLLSEEEIVRICEICGEIGADFVKTSTGFNGEGANIEHVELMRKHLPPKVKIKAAGGIRTREFAEKLMAAGATRIGTSSGVAIVTEI